MTKQKQLIEVIFTKIDNRSWGHIIKDDVKIPMRHMDCYRDHALTCLKMLEEVERSLLFADLPMIRRTKVVYLHKTTPANKIPQDFQMWECEVIEDSKPDDPIRGFLYVVPVRRIEKKLPDGSNEYAIEKEIVPPLEPIKSVEPVAIKKEDPELIISPSAPVLPKTDIDLVAQFLSNEKDAKYKAQTIINFAESLKDKFGWARAIEMLRTIPIKMICDKHNEIKDSATISLRGNQNWVDGAIDYLLNGKKKKVLFVDKGSRYFQCVCNTMNRIGANENRDYQANKIVTIRCSSCGGEGEVRK